MTELTPAVPVAAAPRRSLLTGVLRTPQGLAASLVLLAIVLAVAFAGVLAPYAPNFIDTQNLGAGPSAAHWLGTDPLGRDILSRLMWGGQTNLLGAGLALVVALALGVPTGLVAGFFGGWFDAVANWTTNLIIAIPAIIVLLAVSAILGPSVWISMTVFGIILSPSFFRLVRTSVMAVREELYVDAARVSGLGNVAIIGRHVLSVVRGPLIIQSAFVLGLAIAIQAGLEFLGLGDQTQPSWGQMLNQAFVNIYRAPNLLGAPVAIIVVTTVALAVIANTLRDVLEEGGPGVTWKRAIALSGGTGAQDAGEQPLLDDARAERALLSVHGLRVAYPSRSGVKEVVHGVSFAVERGEILGLVGESGSGKTQTAFSVLGLLPQEGRITAGTLSFDGENLRTISARDYAALRGARIGYIPQEPMSNLIPSFTIGTQLVDPVVAHLKVSRAEARKRVIGLLERVGIADAERVFRSYPHEVSGGMAQRVLIAGAVSCNPELLIADEPTTALDVTVQAEVLDLIRELQRERNLGVLLVTHNFGVVADICDRVAVMQNGRIVEEAPLHDLFGSPQHPYTRMLLGSVLDNREPKTVLSGGTDA